MITIVSLGLISCSNDDDGNKESYSYVNYGYTGTVKLTFHIIPGTETATDTNSGVIVDSIVVNEKSSNNTRIALFNPVSLKSKSLNDTISLQQYVIMPPAESYSCLMYMSSSLRISYGSEELKTINSKIEVLLRPFNNGFVAEMSYDVYIKIYGLEEVVCNVTPEVWTDSKK